MSRIIALLMCFAIVGCTKNAIEHSSGEVIDLNGLFSAQNPDDALDIDKVTLVPLETTEESLLDVFFRVETNGKYLYINDLFQGGGLAVFDISGKFVKRIPNGNGPGEINNMFHFTYDKYRDQLLTYQYGVVNKYTASGDFVELCPVSYFITDFAALPDGYLVVQSESQNERHEFTAIKVNTAFEILETIKIDAPTCIGFVNYMTESADNEIVIPHPFDNKIFAYSNGEINVKQVLDFEDYRFDSSGARSESELYDAMIGTDKYAFRGEYYETTNYQVYKFEPSNTVYRREKDKKCFLGDIKQLPINIMVGAFGDYIICYFASDMIMFDSEETKKSYYEGMTVLSTEQKSLLHNLSDYDNPAIILYSLK